MANPILSRAELEVGSVPLTVQGVVRKTTFLLGLTALAGLAFFVYGWHTQLTSGFVRLISMGSILVAFVLSLVIIAKPTLAKALAVPYALTEGLFVGAISLVLTHIYPTIAFTALSATFVTAAVMLALYRSGVIKVTEKFRSMMLSAMMAIMVLYIVQFIMQLMHSSLPLLFSGGIVAIGFSIFVTVIASFSLLLDFDSIDKAQAAGVSQDYEWVFGVGIVSTLVWMYVEFLRLLSYLQSR